ncbi:MAG: glycosyltransferase family 2 protein [Planctomycetaceae bacterium]|nr:glycosyltransferase family 2 protein [Planctomycetaceae bacterium]
MDFFTIHIPTADRPKMLRTALHSVASQSALSGVDEVLVIENLGNRESENVCKEFPQLPIKYVFRNPPIPPGIDAARDTMSRIRGGRLALLFDDDWWMDHHLERALQSFADHPSAVASYASGLWSTGEKGYITEVYGSFLPWFGCSRPMRDHRWELSLTDLLVICQINTTFHLSSLVVDTQVFNASLECIANGNPYDTDRRMAVEFGRHGAVICDSRPSVFFRTHEKREAVRLHAANEGARWWNESTERLISLAVAEGVDLSIEFVARLARKAIPMETLRPYFGHNSFEILKGKGILPETSVATPPPSWSKSLFRAVTPPVLRDGINSFRRAVCRGRVQ